MRFKNKVYSVLFTALAILLLATTITLLVVFQKELNLHKIIKDVDKEFQAKPVLVTVIYYLVFVVLVSFFFPGSVMTLLGGYIFGLWRGLAIVSTASTLGACVAFLLSRYLIRQRVLRKINGYPKFKAIERAISLQGWRIVVLLRLSPIIPFNISNLMIGISDMKFYSYALATFFGNFPDVFASVYFGSIAREQVDPISHDQVTSPTQFRIKVAFYVIGVIITLIALKLLSNQASKELRKYEEEQQQNNDVEQQLVDESSNREREEN